MRVLAILVSTLAVAISRPRHVPTNSYLPAEADAQHVEEKHFYFYASPNDATYTNFHINVVPKVKKNTKVLFVKAPHHAGVIPNVVAPPSLAEDKTLVYVLLKKPITGQSISIPANLGVKSLKPEVYFLKYGKKHDAEAQVQAGIGGQRVGLNVAELGGEKEFVAVLGNGNGNNGYHYEPASGDDTPLVDKSDDERFTHVELGGGSDDGGLNGQDFLETPSKSDSGDDLNLADKDGDDNGQSSDNGQADDSSSSDTNGDGDDNTNGNGDDNTNGNGDDITNGNGNGDANGHTDTTSDDDNVQLEDNAPVEDNVQSNDVSVGENGDEDDDDDDGADGVSTKVEISDSA